MKQRKWRKSSYVWWVRAGRIVDGKEVWFDATYAEVWIPLYALEQP